MRYKLEIKWAIILFVVTIIWMTFEKLMGWHGANISQHATYTNIYDLLLAGVFALAFLEKRKTTGTESFEFKTGLLFGLGITLIITLLSPITQTIIHRLISPEFFPNIIKFAVDNNALSQEAAEAYFNLGSYIFQNIIGTSILGAICSVLFAFIFKRE